MERLKSLGYAGFSGGSDPATRGHDLPDPKDRIATYELISDAIADSQHGRYQESIEKLKGVIKTEPNSVPAHYMQGLNYYRLSMFPEAVDELQKTVQLSPDYALALFNLGMAQAHAGQMDAAIATLQRTLQLDATNFEAAFNLGVAFIQKKQLDPAAEAFRQSVTIYPEFARGHRALGETLLYQGNTDEAIAELRRAVELAPQEPIMHESLAKALTAKGLTAEADEETRRAQQHPRRSRRMFGRFSKFPTRLSSALPLAAVMTLAAAVTGFAQSTAIKPAQANPHPKTSIGQSPPNRPSVILITIDTVRADHVGCYGAQMVKTPTLDALAHDGVVFERAISQVPLTWPSHAVILTGTYPFQNGVQDFTGQPLAQQFRSVAQAFKQAGYATGAVSVPSCSTAVGDWRAASIFMMMRFRPGHSRKKISAWSTVPPGRA